MACLFLIHWRIPSSHTALCMYKNCKLKLNTSSFIQCMHVCFLTNDTYNSSRENANLKILNIFCGLQRTFHCYYWLIPRWISPNCCKHYIFFTLKTPSLLLLCIFSLPFQGFLTLITIKRNGLFECPCQSFLRFPLFEMLKAYCIFRPGKGRRAQPRWESQIRDDKVSDMFTAFWRKIHKGTLDVNLRPSGWKQLSARDTKLRHQQRSR